MLPPEKEGILVKRGHVRKNWKRRWFLLHNDGRLEYQTVNRKATKGCIFLSSYTVKIASQLDLKMKSTQNIIHLVPQSLTAKEYFLKTENELDMKEWLRTLSFAADEAKKRDRLQRMEDGKPVKKDFSNQKFFSNVTNRAVTTPDPRRSNSLPPSSERRNRKSVKSIREHSILGGDLQLSPSNNQIIVLCQYDPVTAEIARGITESGNIVRFITLNGETNTDGEFPVYSIDKAGDAFDNAHSFFITHSVTFNTTGITDILSIAKTSGVCHIVKLTFFGYMNELETLHCNIKLRNFLDFLNIPLTIVAPSIPYEYFTGFANTSSVRSVFNPFSEDQIIPFVSLLDIAEVCEQILLSSHNGQNMIILSHTNYTLSQIIDMMKEIKKEEPIIITEEQEFGTEKQPPTWLSTFHNTIINASQNSSSLCSQYNDLIKFLLREPYDLNTILNLTQSTSFRKSF